MMTRLIALIIAIGAIVVMVRFMTLDPPPRVEAPNWEEIDRKREVDALNRERIDSLTRPSPLIEQLKRDLEKQERERRLKAIP